MCLLSLVSTWRGCLWLMVVDLFGCLSNIYLFTWVLGFNLDVLFLWVVG